MVRGKWESEKLEWDVGIHTRNGKEESDEWRYGDVEMKRRRKIAM